MANDNRRMTGDAEYPLNRADLPLAVGRSLADVPAVPEPEPFPAGFFHGPPCPAAVLMPLVYDRRRWHLLFIRRTEHAGDRHSGQVAFPGGHVDATDASHEAAALREAEEEIGLRPDNVLLLGRLGFYHTVSNFQVTPVVGQVRNTFEPLPDPREVDHVFYVPLDWLADPANLERRPRRLPGTDIWFDVLYYRPYEGELLWGVTARLVSALVERITSIG
jgi:8-oxo-dGTP pyrophosphatase MutT (NUDIX family)